MDALWSNSSPSADPISPDIASIIEPGATAVPDRATRGPRTSALPAVRGQLKSPNPRSAVRGRLRHPRSALNPVRGRPRRPPSGRCSSRDTVGSHRCLLLRHDPPSWGAKPRGQQGGMGRNCLVLTADICSLSLSLSQQQTLLLPQQHIVYVPDTG